MNVSVFGQKKLNYLTFENEPIAEWAHHQAYKAKEHASPCWQGLEAERYAMKSHRKKDEALPWV